MIFAAIKFRFANLALSVGAIVYGSYGLCRLISMAFHGLPSESLIIATLIELSIATALVVLRITVSAAHTLEGSETYLSELATRPAA